jgi:hypothetical protein
VVTRSRPYSFCANQSVETSARSAIDTDPTFAAIRNSSEYDELLAAAQACRARFREHLERKSAYAVKGSKSPRFPRTL